MSCHCPAIGVPETNTNWHWDTQGKSAKSVTRVIAVIAKWIRTTVSRSYFSLRLLLFTVVLRSAVATFPRGFVLRSAVAPFPRGFVLRSAVAPFPRGFVLRSAVAYKVRHFAKVSSLEMPQINEIAEAMEVQLDESATSTSLMVSSSTPEQVPTASRHCGYVRATQRVHPREAVALVRVDHHCPIQETCLTEVRDQLWQQVRKLLHRLVHIQLHQGDLVGWVMMVKLVCFKIKDPWTNIMWLKMWCMIKDPCINTWM